MEFKHPCPKNTEELKRLWHDAFGDGYEDIDLFFKTAFSFDHSLCAFVGDRVVASLYWIDCEYKGEKAAYLYAISTDIPYRGRGICSELMMNAHSLLKSLGYLGAILVPGEKSLFDFYKKMGYVSFGSVFEGNAIAKDTGTLLRRIDSSEYAQIRRAMLPYGGVIQEKKSLDYLSSYAELYFGDGVLIASFEKDGHLRIVELLGDNSAVEGIIYALGCREGSYRTPGSGRELAMYLSFKENNDTPTYFGLAFD